MPCGDFTVPSAHARAPAFGERAQGLIISHRRYHRTRTSLCRQTNNRKAELVNEAKQCIESLHRMLIPCPAHQVSLPHTGQCAECRSGSLLAEADGAEAERTRSYARHGRWSDLQNRLSTPYCNSARRWVTPTGEQAAKGRRPRPSESLEVWRFGVVHPEQPQIFSNLYISQRSEQRWGIGLLTATSTHANGGLSFDEFSVSWTSLLGSLGDALYARTRPVVATFTNTKNELMGFP